MKKRIVALLLAVMCSVMLLPAAAFGAGYDYTLRVTYPSSGSITLENGRTDIFTFSTDEEVDGVTLKSSSSDTSAVDTFVAFGTADSAYVYPRKVTSAPVVLTFWLTRSGVQVSNAVEVHVSVIPGTHSVSCMVAEGEGTVSVDKPQATAGDTVTITTTPEEGYKLKALTVSSDGAGVVEVSESGTFTMPEANVAVVAEFEEIPAEPTDPAEPTPVVPQTGDSSGLVFYALAGIALLGACVVVIARKKANR